MKGSALAISVIILGVFAVIGMLAFIFLHSSSNSQPSADTSAAAATTSAPVKDFDPSLPMSQKTTILIQTSDSSDIKYIVPKDQVNTYVKSLPEGYHVISTSQ